MELNSIQLYMTARKIIKKQNVYILVYKFFKSNVRIG